MMNDLTGQQFGSYRLVRRLGTGGFASVYLGQHVRLSSKQAAIKILHMFDANVSMFQKEAETTEQLIHPHIVRLLDFDLQDGIPFLVLEYAPGGSLRDRHPEGSQIPLATAIAYAHGIASALQYAHEQHLIHRDIKPENILIGRQGELQLSDFGITVMSKTGRTSLAAGGYGQGGTPYYMAPEQFRGKPEKASDQYALAVLVYEWLTGMRPFEADEPAALGYQHRYEPIPPLPDTIPLPVQRVILKALEKEPEERYPSVQAFAQALLQARDEQVTGVEQYRAQGDAQLHMNQFSEALASFEKLMQIDEKDASAHIGKGQALLRLNRYQEALAAFEAIQYQISTEAYDTSP